MAELRDRVFAVAKVQAVHMDSLLTEGRYPRTFQDGQLVTTDIGWWCSGFYPGVLWQVYVETKEERFRDLAIKYTVPLAGLLERETDHDIGFQLMSSFHRWSEALFLLPQEDKVLSSDEIEEILDAGARKLAARFNPEIGAIRSWNGARWNYPVIIDNMMNLSLLNLHWYRDIAEKHALTTAKNHFREDGTAVHLVDYADDGTVLGRQTVQGYADDTAWARGQAWA